MILASFVVLNLAFWQVEGFIYHLRHYGSPLAKCYTNESDRAVAFTRNLYVRQPPRSSTVKYSPIIEGEKFTGAPCHLPQNCASWIKPKYTTEHSLKPMYQLPPVFDRRWNDFEEFVLLSNAFPLKMFDIGGEASASGVFHLSIVAHNEVQIVFSQDEQFLNVVLLKLGARVKTTDGKYGLISEIQYCTKFLFKSESCRNRSPEKWHSKDIMMNGNAWNLFSFNYSSSSNQFEISIQLNSETILDPTKINYLQPLSVPWRVGAKSVHTTALIKVHSYFTTRPINRNAVMHTDVTVTQNAPKICLELTYFYYKEASHQPISVEIKNSSKVLVFTTYLTRNTEDFWKIAKVKTATLPQGKYSIAIQIIPKATYIGAINDCVDETEIVTSEDADVKDCELLGKSKANKIINGLDNGLTELEAEVLCNSNSNCEAVEFCGMPDDCHCLSGYSQRHRKTIHRCTEKCDSGHYGANCSKHPRAKECFYGYNIHNGDCQEKCDPFQRAPDCTTPRLVLLKPPKISRTGSKNKVLVDLTDAVEDFKEKYGVSYVTDHLLYIQLQQISVLMDQNQTNLYNLYYNNYWTTLSATPGITYFITATAVERDGWNSTNTMSTTNFTICIPLDEHNTRIEVREDLRVSITQDFKVCAWESVTAWCRRGNQWISVQLDVSNPVLTNLVDGDECELSVAPSLYQAKFKYAHKDIKTTITKAPTETYRPSLTAVSRTTTTTTATTPKSTTITASRTRTSNTLTSTNTTTNSISKVSEKPPTLHVVATNGASKGHSITELSTVEESTVPNKNKIGSKIAIGTAVFIVLGALILALLLYGRKRFRGQPQRLIDESAAFTKEVEKGTELKVLTTLEHAPATYAEEVTECGSCLVPLAELEPYIKEALRTDWLKQQHESFPRGQTRSWVVGSQPTNKAKNRYGNLTAYDATRVVLDIVPGDPYSDYINANFIDGYNQPKAYIATQGPKPQTVLDFWRMVWQERVNVVVMVANCIETGRDKCEKYWPDQQKSLSFGDFTIKNVGEELFADYTCRDLVICKGENNRKITHMHFTTWPDHHVPLYPQSLAEFTRKTIQIPTDSPIAVHCSAGVGRTGTYILVDACLRMAASEGSVDILGIFGRMRQHRPNMVDNHEQYKFAHRVLFECLVLPQFALPSSDFEESLKGLRSKNKSKLRKNYTRLSEICKSEWAGKGIQSGMAMEADKCRYPEFTACSSHSVKMFPYGDGAPVSFVNAVYVDGFRQKSQFVATQVPMAHTVEHFWRLVHQHKTDWIIVLNEPAGKQCKPEGIYLPDQGGCLVLADLKIVAQDEKTSYGDLVYTIFQNDVKQGTVNVIQHQGWAARNSSGSSAEDLVNLWEDTQRRLTKSTTFVVCHDGVTACGLFLGIGFVLEKLKLEQQVDAAMATRILRLVRPQFIRNFDQYEMLYEAALVYLQNFDTYGNFQ